MKFLVLIGDGMADFPLAACGGNTPLAAARTPAMDELAHRGVCGLFMPIPDGFPAGSDIGNLSLFGYDPHTDFTGRAPLEAVNQGIRLRDDELVFRCNLVTLNAGQMEDFTAGHIPSEEAAELIELLNAKLGNDSLKFHAGVSYRHLATMRAPRPLLNDLLRLKCTPPHDIIGRAYAKYLPRGDNHAGVHKVMEDSQAVLSDAPTNDRRRKRGDLAATSVWLWGQGQAPKLASYKERFGLDGAVISAVDLVNGIGRAAGFEVIRVPGATGYLDTNYEGKVSAALSALDRVDFVYLHVEAPDEASHEGSVEKKLQAIEDFDARVVRPCLDFAIEHGDCRVVVAPDHVTSIESRTHASGPVPFALYGPGIEPDARRRYSEEAAAEAGVLFPRGHELVAHMITSASIAAHASRTKD